ncbi:hypothetical protein SLEP1_g34965 [Rubroshorea leprosula]|uniref:Uncharacterized protein n=1 Tax=Rubroshorea leprosula TaxID=152421 RepID=A0AAV5KM46_9ROSI|nr:hypothetical protein SLEP1_g34965 [Rubroshorea leprosula]
MEKVLIDLSFHTNQIFREKTIKRKRFKRGKGEDAVSIDTGLLRGRLPSAEYQQTVTQYYYRSCPFLHHDSNPSLETSLRNPQRFLNSIPSVQLINNTLSVVILHRSSDMFEFWRLWLVSESVFLRTMASSVSCSLQFVSQPAVRAKQPTSTVFPL